MSDLIRRQAVKNLITMKPYDWSNITERRAILLEIDKLPSSEPERKKGRWIPDKSGIVYWNCSECGFASEAFGADILYHFCPNCGCKMDWSNDE